MNIRKSVLIVILIAAFQTNDSITQDILSYPDTNKLMSQGISIYPDTNQLMPQDISSYPDSNKINNGTLLKAIAITGTYYAGSMYILSKTWYKDRRTVPFHFYNDNRENLQVDKFGHTFGSYFYSYLGYHVLLNLGLTNTESLIFGGSLGFIMQAPIEIMDGIHEGWGFSWGDIAANATGSILVIGQELLFKEQMIKYKFSYWESIYSKQANGYLGKNSFERLLHDYNGHTYWLSIPINKIISNDILPDWLNFAVGYGANGMFGDYQNIKNYNGVEIPDTFRYRQYLLSLDIDWTKIETDSNFWKVILQGLTFIKFPFLTLEYNSLGKFKGYWLYY